MKYIIKTILPMPNLRQISLDISYSKTNLRKHKLFQIFYEKYIIKNVSSKPNHAYMFHK